MFSHQYANQFIFLRFLFNFAIRPVDRKCNLEEASSENAVHQNENIKQMQLRNIMERAKWI